MDRRKRVGITKRPGGGRLQNPCQHRKGSYHHYSNSENKVACSSEIEISDGSEFARLTHRDGGWDAILYCRCITTIDRSHSQVTCWCLKESIQNCSQRYGARRGKDIAANEAHIHTCEEDAISAIE
jgi:hypothetical protein